MSTVLVSCVTENTDQWFRKVFNLVLSLRAFGGSLSGAPMVVNFVEAVEPRFERQLVDLGATVRVVEPWGARFRFSNKLRMLELAGEFDFDVLFAVDCDVLIAGDVSLYGSHSSIRMTPADRDPFTPDQWKVVFADLGIPEPPRDCVMRVTEQRTYPYFNSGVMFIPRLVMPDLAESWTRSLRDFDSLSDRFPGAHHENQIAFALAVVRAGLPVDPLPISMNLPTTASVGGHFSDEIHPPYVIHYHHDINEQGFVLSSRNQVVNEWIDKLNRKRSEVTGVPYEGLESLPLIRRVQRSAKGRSWYRNQMLRSLRGSKLASRVKRRIYGSIDRSNGGARQT